MDTNNIFFNEYNRLRSGWRLAIFLLALVFCAGMFFFVVLAPLARLGFEVSPGTLNFILINSAANLFFAVVLGWFFGKHLEDLPFRALGVALTKNWLKDLFFGITLGAFTLVLAILIGMVFGGLSFRFNAEAATSQILTTLGFSLFVFIIGGASEEALFRGYMLQTFARARLAWLAILLTSLFFGFVHLKNPGASYISSLNTILAGIWFSVAYLKTRTLWLPFGLHLIWNWMQGAIFGIEVSGLKNLTAAPLLREIEQSPAWLTGAEYGIEGGFASTIAIVFSIVLLYFLPFLKPTEEMLALTSREFSHE